MASINQYVALINDFVNDKIEAKIFERQYFELFTKDAGQKEEVFLILDWLFAEADAFEADSDIRNKNHIDEKQLLASAKKALQQLKSLK